MRASGPVAPSPLRSSSSARLLPALASGSFPSAVGELIAVRHRSARRTGLLVSEICPGSLTFGDSDDLRDKIGSVQPSDAERRFRESLDAAINCIDIAELYSGGLSKQIIGQALKNLKVARERYCCSGWWTTKLVLIPKQHSTSHRIAGGNARFCRPDS